MAKHLFRCEAFPTYPRTYDMVHADGLLSLEKSHKHRCSTLDIFLEVDRILRPEVSNIWLITLIWESLIQLRIMSVIHIYRIFDACVTYDITLPNMGLLMVLNGEKVYMLLFYLLLFLNWDLVS